MHKIKEQINVLIAGRGELFWAVKKSKFLKKIYITSEEEIEGAVNIKFNTFRELAQKCKSLQIDFVIVENEKWIMQGIVDILRKNFVNCIAPTAHWASTLKNNSSARSLLKKYEIPTPQTLSYPKTFPLLLRADGLKYTVETMEDLIKIKQEMNKMYSPEILKTVFLEEYIDGEVFNLCSLFDGKNLKSFKPNNINQSVSRALDKYSDSLEFLLTSEKADFTGFLNSRLIFHGGIFYNAGFNFKIKKEDLDNDFLFILSSCIYQKLNEL